MLCLCGGWVDLCCEAGLELLAFGGFDWVVRADSCELLGFVNEWNPSLERAFVPAVEPTRASWGDMAGA